MHASARVAIAVLVAVTAALAGLWLARSRAPEPLALEHATLFPAARALPEFELLDQRREPFGRQRLAGRWSLLFFGFTQCPDVCPTTLATLAAVRRELASLPAPLLPEVVLVSVDPGRDTPERLAEYVAFFDPSFTGVTGETAALRSLTEGLGVAVIVGQADAGGNYTVDHSTSVFLVNPQGAVAAVFSAPHTPDGIAHDYRLIVERLAGDAT
jgi:protein SCO1/2